MKFINPASFIKQIDGGASASTYVTAENIDGGNSIS